MSSAQHFLKQLAKPHLLFFVLLWFMVLLVWGTLAQYELGIYRAQKMFFSAWIVWLGPIPLPAGYTTLGIIAISLLAKLTVGTKWRWKEAGNITAHIGVCLLLLSGLVDALYTEEGFISLSEGQPNNQISDYFEREFVIEKNGETVLALPESQLHIGNSISNADLPFSLTIKEYCSHCGLEPLKVPRADGVGPAKHIKLIEKPTPKEVESRAAGLLLELEGRGLYLSHEMLIEMEGVEIDEDVYKWFIRPNQTPLPFSLSLEKFTRKTHPGTNAAKYYSSSVTVLDGDISWKALIEMNEPLRYQDYTFYQSSFAQSKNTTKSILAVVKNPGYALPYLSSGLLCLGLLWHTVMRTRHRRLHDHD